MLDALEATALRPTPAAHQQAVRELYLSPGDSATPAWSGDTLALHFGLDVDGPSSFEDSLLETTREMARLARIQRGQRVLDAGCGLGGSAVFLAQAFGAEVTGISLVPEQIAQAERAARERGVGGVSFHVADYMATGLAPRSFDVVWNLESLCHCHDVEAYLAHARSLLADGGRIACMDVFLAEGEGDADGDAEALRDMADGGGFGRLQALADLAAMLARVGFVDIEVVDLRARALRSATCFQAMAQQFWRREQFCEAVFGLPTQRQQRHAKASLACAQAVLSGALTYAYIGARRSGQD